MSSTSQGGFDRPNYTQTPNILFDDLLPVISNAELRVTLVLIRQTLGWHRQKTEKMSVSELAAAAGISDSSAKTGVSEGVRRGTIKRFKARDHLNRTVYRYALVIRSDLDASEIERPKKPKVSPVQDGMDGSSYGQKLPTLKFTQVSRVHGQILTIWPVQSHGQKLPMSYKEERNPFEVKKEEEGGDVLSGGSRHSSSSSNFEGRTEKQQAPDGAAAHAARGHTPSQAQDTGSAGGRIDTATSTEQVPGAAAAALASVSEIRPVPQAELDARSCWTRTSPEMDLLVTYGGTLVKVTLTEPTPVRALPRAQWWTRLTTDEIHLAGLTASREAQRENGNMKTLFYRALDRLVGAIPAEKPAGAGEGRPGVLGADPMLSPGDGVRVDSTEGVVEMVTAAAYRVQLVDSTTVTLDRAVHAHLGRIQRLGYVPTLPDGRAENLVAGKLWKHKRQGHTIRIQEVQGGRVTTHDGETMTVLDLNRHYEAV